MSRKRDKIATAEDFAKLTFKDEGPAFGKALGSIDKWMKIAQGDYETLIFAVAILRKNHDEMAKIVTQEPEGQRRLCDCLDGKAERFEGLSNVLRAAHLRMLAGMARAACSEG